MHIEILSHISACVTVRPSVMIGVIISGMLIFLSHINTL